MRRACGTAFLLGALFFFPFPNLLIAPGYSQLPKLHVPSLNEAVNELPESARVPMQAFWSETKFQYDQFTDAMGFYSRCFHGFLFQFTATFFSSYR